MRFALAAVAVLVLACSTVAIEVNSKGAGMPDNDTINADSLLALADEVFSGREYDRALEMYNQALVVAKEEFNRPVETESLAQLARIYLTTDRKEEGRPFLEQATQIASDSDPLGWTRFLGVRGRYEWKDDDLTSARRTFDDMYVYSNTSALWSRAVDAANMLAIVSEKPEDQIEWSKRGIEAAESGMVESWLGPLWNNLGATYWELKQYDSALTCYQNAREFHWRFSGEIQKLFADYHIGMTYRYLGQYDEAGQWLRPVLAWAERLGEHSAIGQACEDLGEVAVATGDKAEGLKLLKRARDEYKAAGYDQSWKEIYDAILKRIDQVENE